MRREALIPFLPAALAVVTDAVTVCVVTAHQPDYPARAVVYQVVMLGAALLSAVPRKWVRIVGFVLLLAGVFISMAVGLLYLPTFFAAVWVMTRDERPAVQPGQEGPGK
jgi:cell division protein FtsW (lipid II flippase)